ncbi:Glycosyl transferase family 2 [Parapedobacter luteus]|uniref:Glycosyl transferase family 2 n=1 Tax=Parapedobacter luteus TaxID=623280 RepID=A0A1T5DFF3_9SPHI|nr:glycosyltransferase [Parapedobacter luteus]SKB70432.1 Glycosyl transferase family 2 [Parapedobacter luteus]
MTCSIIIRSYNEERHIGRLMDGIQRQQLPVGVSLEVIVVDSGSNDSTVAIAKSMGAKIIKIKKENFSFGRALNIGCNQAKGDILLFASAHVYPVFNDWIEKMIAPFSSQRVALVYGRQIGNEQTHFSEQQVFEKWFPSKSNYVQSTPFCNNANCAIRKKLWESQHYNESLTGLEDLDWAQKIMNKGHQIVYEADAVIVHVHEETPKKIKNRYQREAIALKQILPRVHFDFFDFLWLFTSNTASDWFHALQKGILWKEWKNIISFRFMQFYGTYLGHKQKGIITQELKNRFYYPNGISKAKHPENESRRYETGKKIEYD